MHKLEKTDGREEGKKGNDISHKNKLDEQQTI
jgi:hypothetical protein